MTAKPHRDGSAEITPAAPDGAIQRQMHQPAPAIAVLRLDTSDLPLAEQFAGWTATIPAYDVQRRVDEVGFTARSEAWLLGGLVLSMTTIPPVRLLRTPERLLADGGDQYSIVVNCQGGLECHLDDRSVSVPPGGVCVLDNAAAFMSESTEATFLILLVPRDLLAHDRMPVPLHGYCPPGLQGQFLADYLRALHHGLPGLPASELTRVSGATVDLLNACLAAGATGSRAKPWHAQDLVSRAKRHVDTHVGPRITVLELARALGLSRTQLYRAFAPAGGVDRFIIRRQLARARQALEEPGNRRTVDAIAHDCGFRSSAHFSRLFRQRYGLTPKALQSRARLPRPAARIEAPSEVARAYVEWTIGHS